MNTNYILAGGGLLLLSLLAVLIKALWGQFSPIVVAVVTGLTAHATKYATAYAYGALLAVTASLQAMAEVATQQGWVYCAAAAKILQPGLVAVLAYVRPSPGQQNAPADPPAKAGAP